MLATLHEGNAISTTAETGDGDRSERRDVQASRRRPASAAETARRRAQMKEQGEIVAERFRQLRQGRSE